jgi:hypothetical protein
MKTAAKGISGGKRKENEIMQKKSGSIIPSIGTRELMHEHQTE